jgi:hypothetical protein
LKETSPLSGWGCHFDCLAGVRGTQYEKPSQTGALLANYGGNPTSKASPVDRASEEQFAGNVVGSDYNHGWNSTMMFQIAVVFLGGKPLPVPLFYSCTLVEFHAAKKSIFDSGFGRLVPPANRRNVGIG